MESRRSRGWWWRLGLLAVLAALVSACATEQLPKNTLDPAGPGARSIDNLFMPVFWVAVAVFVLVEGLIVFAVFRWRRRPGDDEVPEQTHGNTRLEVGWTILPALVLAVIAVPTVATLFELFERPEGEEVLEVEVWGQQFWWAYEYEEITYEGSDENLVTANELHIPVDTAVYLTLRSNDVIHSFWSPRLNGKRDVVPGRVHNWSIQADRPGRYLGQCAEFCGASHANMLFAVVAHDEAGWQEWLDDAQEIPPPPPPAPEGTTVDTDAAAEGGDELPDRATLAAEGFELFGNRGCAGCHVIEGAYDEVDPEQPPAPNLTHLFDRECFAGCMFELNRNNLEAWLRDPPGLKPGALMPNLGLTEEDIDKLYAYLETLD